MRAGLILFLIIIFHMPVIYAEDTGTILISCSSGVDIYVDGNLFVQITDKQDGLVLDKLKLKSYRIGLNKNREQEDFGFTLGTDTVFICSKKFNLPENIQKYEIQRRSNPNTYFPIDKYPLKRITYNPPYPSTICNLGRHDTLFVQSLVNDEGYVENVLIEKSTGVDELDSIAIKAAYSFVFKPAHHRRKPVYGWVKSQVVFDNTLSLEAGEIYPQVVKFTYVKYPRVAQQAGWDGMVIGKVLIDIDGKVSRCYAKKISVLDNMVDAVNDICDQNLFNPGSINGSFTPIWFTYYVHFIHDYYYFYDRDGNKRE